MDITGRTRPPTRNDYLQRQAPGPVAPARRPRSVDGLVGMKRGVAPGAADQQSNSTWR